MKRTILFTLALMVLLAAQSVSAQFAGQMFMVIDGDIWAWDEGYSAPYRVTQSGAIQEISVSPNGSRLAYTELPPNVVDAIQREGGFGGGALPTDMWVMELDGSQTAFSLGVQPQNASFAVQGVPDNGLVRSRPVWSPDGTRLAWTEYNLLEQGSRQWLMTYDLKSGLSDNIVGDLSQTYGVPAPIPVMGWANTGIVLLTAEASTTQDIGFQQTFWVYDPSGNRVSTTPLPEAAPRYYSGSVLLTDQGRDYIGVRYGTGEWDLINMQTGSLQPAPTIPQLYSASSPNTSVSVAQISGDVNSPTVMQIFDTQGNPVGDLIDVGQDPFGTTMISPDGQTVAIHMTDLQTGVFNPFWTLWRDGQQVGTAPIDPSQPAIYPQSIVWGPTAWSLGHVPMMAQTSPPASTSFDCPGAPPTLLALGDVARVTPTGGANNLRNSPSLSGTKIGQIPEGDIFSVTNGPVCADGMVWWQVDYNGQTGWTVEGQNGIYYVAKIQ